MSVVLMHSTKNNMVVTWLRCAVYFETQNKNRDFGLMSHMSIKEAEFHFENTQHELPQFLQ